MEDWSRGPRLPIAAGILAASITLWQWGGFHATPVVYDESAYLLQAELLASGHWSRPSPPLFAAFTQPAVLVTPVLAPKMPPGHALLLAPGVLLHLPGLVPILLVGLTAALLAILVRRFAGSGTAVIAVVLWVTQAGQGRWRGSYLSENTTTVLWLFGWWSLLRWRETRRGHWLLLLAAATGWGAITRPLTMIAFAIPVAVIVIRDTMRNRTWPQFGAAVAVGVALLMIIPVQNTAILGKWNRSPLGLYTRQYLPFDKMGFGFDATPPLLAAPPYFAAYDKEFVALHQEHQLQALPRILASRLRVAWNSNFARWRLFLMPVMLLALVLLPRAAWLGVASTALLYLGYLGYAHEAHWSVYYAEAMPVAAGVIAVGLAWLVGRGPDPGSRAEMGRVLIAIVILLWATPDLRRWGTSSRGAQERFREFESEVADIYAPPSLVFVRHAPGQDPHASLVRNVANPATAPVITAFDLGDSARAIVRAAYPARQAFIWDEATRRLTADRP